MRLRGIFLAAAIPGATALHQRVVVHQTGAVDLPTPRSNMSNFTETIASAPPPPLKTAVSDKPAVEASIMGLVVFSAAGLVLL
ncbi:hypothetical protein NUW58_g5325 [Xylaria curta]|uniref:Uncharacterized protein n=1 Tax=Xylaria curta TaxID=42375 RepID=A0ACC1P235_9PEZI|nr:hypothetical protein NUW58_g5325 [Xylaria curta]